MTDILIYGAGAIGSFLGYLLSEMPGKNAIERKRIENVALLGREGHINAIKEQGLHVDLGEKREVLFFRHCFSSLDEFKASNYHPRLVIICVKTYSLPDLSRELKESGLLEERFKESQFILLMNGMGNRELFLNSGLDPARLQEGITSLGVLLAGEGIALDAYDHQAGMIVRCLEFIQTGEAVPEKKDLSLLSQVHMQALLLDGTDVPRSA